MTLRPAPDDRPRSRHLAPKGTPAGFTWTVPAGRLFISWSAVRARGITSLHRWLRDLDKVAAWEVAAVLRGGDGPAAGVTLTPAKVAFAGLSVHPRGRDSDENETSENETLA